MAKIVVVAFSGPCSLRGRRRRDKHPPHPPSGAMLGRKAPEAARLAAIEELAI